MPFNFKCQHCSTELEAQDEWSGLQTKCPNCQAEILIQKDVPPPAPVAPAQVQIIALPEKFVFMCPECGQITELEADQNGKQIECPNCAETVTAVPTEERPCPFCGENIKLKAKVCKHCKKQVPPFSSAPSNTSKQPVWNPDEKLCPKCGQTIKKQAAFCRHCKQDIGNIVANVGNINVNNVDASSLPNESIMDDLFNKFALAVMPFLAAKEFQNKNNVRPGIHPFFKFLFWLIGIGALIGSVSNIYQSGMIWKDLKALGIGYSILGTAIICCTLSGIIDSYRSKNKFALASLFLMLLNPIFCLFLLGMQVNSIGYSIMEMLVIGGNAAANFWVGMLALNFLRNKPFKFDALTVASCWCSSVGALFQLILFYQHSELGGAFKIIPVIIFALVIYVVLKLYVVAWIKSKFGNNQNA